MNTVDIMGQKQKSEDLDIKFEKSNVEEVFDLLSGGSPETKNDTYAKNTEND